MSSDEGVLVCQSCNEAAARLRVAVVAPHPRMEAVRAVPPQKRSIFFFLIISCVRPFSEVHAIITRFAHVPQQRHASTTMKINSKGRREDVSRTTRSRRGPPAGPWPAPHLLFDRGDPKHVHLERSSPSWPPGPVELLCVS